MIPLDAERLKISVDMCFYPKTSFVACPDHSKFKSHAENWHENQNTAI